MRRLSDGVNLYESAVAERLGMHPTDLHFLGLVELYGPTTAGHLAELGGLTTGAVTGVLDRLERAGYVRREPDPEDRRRVVVRLVEDSTRRRPALRAAPRRVRPVYDRYTDDELATILDYADRLRPLVQEQASTLRAGTERPSTAPAARAPTATVPLGAGRRADRGDAALPPRRRSPRRAGRPRPRRALPGRVPVERRHRQGRSRRRQRAVPQVAVRLAGQARRAEAQHLGRLARRDGRGLHPLRRRLTGVACSASRSPAASATGRSRCRRRGIVPVRITGGVNDLTVTRPAGTGRSSGAGRRGERDLRRPALGRGRRGRQLASREGADGADRYEIELIGGAKTLVVATAEG